MKRDLDKAADSRFGAIVHTPWLENRGVKQRNMGWTLTII